MLEETARLTRILLDALPCVALLLRPGSREIIAANEAAARCGAIPGSYCYRAWFKREDPCPWCLAQTAWTSFEPQQLEVDALGSIWDAHWIPVSDDLYVHYAFDITERKKVEEALRKSETRFSSFFKASPVGISFSRLKDKRILEVNDLWQKITGYDRLEAIGRTPTELNLWVDPDDSKRIVEKLFTLGALRDCEVQIRQKSGDVVNLLISMEQVELESEQCLLAMALNVTERQQAEKALRESEEKFRHLVEAASEGFCKVDENFTITYVNRQMAEMLGYRPEEMVGRLIGNFMFPEDLASHAIQKANRRKGLLEKNERRFRHKNGTDIWTIVSPKPTIDGEGKFRGSFATFTDITLRKKMESVLLEKQQLLQALAIRMSEVEELERKEISRTLHDLVGQNLTALNLNLNIAISMLPEKTSSIIIHRLEDAQKLLEETTQHIREVMSGLRPSVLDDFGLLAALYWYGERLKALTGIETNIEGKEFSPRLPPTMESIIFRIAQEALTNVSKHAGADQVDIVLEERPGKVQLTISDNGWGFLFKGFRLGGEKRGWGLATMKERAAALGGDLEVQSKPGKGTRIILQLPVER